MNHGTDSFRVNMLRRAFHARLFSAVSASLAPQGRKHLLGTGSNCEFCTAPLVATLLARVAFSEFGLGCDLVASSE